MAPRPNEWTQMQQFLEDFQENFQDNMRRTMAEAIQAGVQAGVQAAFAANAVNADPAAQPQRQQRRNNPVFEEQNDDSGADNPFGDDDNQHPNLNRGQQHRNDNDSRWFSGIKVDIPEFHGGSQPEELLDWLVAVDEFLEFKEVSANKQVPYCNNSIPRSRCVLGNRSVDEYATEFYQLLTRVDIHDSEDQLVARFIAGLRPQLQIMLHQFDPGSVAEAKQRALLVEQQMRYTANAWTGNSRQRSNTVTDDSKTSSGLDSTNSTRRNNRPTETNAATNTNDARPPARINALRCFTCGETGHRQTACPNAGRRGLMANDRDLIGDPIYDTEDGQFDDIDEGELSGDTGTLLMLRRNCFAPISSEAVQRTALFSSTCTIKGKFPRKLYANSPSQRRTTPIHTDSHGCKQVQMLISLNAHCSHSPSDRPTRIQCIAM
uniref:CCHC-type domain-containing protein n=1 Tax=Brassica oleracea var. oleracea TaxID=109376 RepID=A0A0D3AQT4_BRAOL